MAAAYQKTNIIDCSITTAMRLPFILSIAAIFVAAAHGVWL